MIIDDFVGFWVSGYLWTWNTHGHEIHVKFLSSGRSSHVLLHTDKYVSYILIYMPYLSVCSWHNFSLTDVSQALNSWVFPGSKLSVLKWSFNSQTSWPPSMLPVAAQNPHRTYLWVIILHLLFTCSKNEVPIVPKRESSFFSPGLKQLMQLTLWMWAYVKIRSKAHSLLKWEFGALQILFTLKS